MKKDLRTVRVCAGIGDNVWLIQKLLGSGEKFNWRIAGDVPKRGKQIFDLTSKIVARSSYDDTFNSGHPIAEGVQKWTNKWSDVTDNEFPLSMNTHLEEGRRIEEFMPDLKTTFDVKWKTSRWRAAARKLLPGRRTYVGLYGSAYSSLRNWGFWGADQWGDLAKRVRGFGDVTFVVMGASFDVDLASDLAVVLHKHNLKYVMLVGKPLGLVIEVMKRLDYFFSFPSGLGILSTSVGCPTLMFYPEHLEPMTWAWADPELIEDGTYVGAPFCTVSHALDIAVDLGRLKRRL